MRRRSNGIISLYVVLFAFAPGPAVGQERWSTQWEEKLEALLPSEVIMDAIGIRAGMTVAEIGAGNGRFAVRLARRVARSGTVYANDIDPEALAFMRRRCRDESLENIVVVDGREGDPRLPRRAMDAIVMINTLHMVREPMALLKNAIPALKPDGVLVVIDFDKVKLVRLKEAKGEVIPPKEHYLKLLADAGFVVRGEPTFLPRHYFVVLHPAGVVQAGPPVESRGSRS